MCARLWKFALVALACGWALAPAPGLAARKAVAAPHPTGTASARATAAPTATPTPAPQARARDAYDGIVHGTLDRSQLSPALDAELSAARLAGYARVLGPLGPPQSFTLAGTHDIDGTTTYDYVVRYVEGAVSFTYGLDNATQRVTKLYVRTTRS